MAGEVLFGVDHARAVLGEPATLADAGLREWAHLQEWVIAHPRILAAWGPWHGDPPAGALPTTRRDPAGGPRSSPAPCP